MRSSKVSQRNRQPPTTLPVHNQDMSFALEFTHDYNFTVYNATASWGCVDDCCSMIDTATSGAPHVQA